MNPVERQIEQSIYMLKREYGAPVTVYQLLSASVDERTGVRTESKAAYEVDLAVVLPESLSLIEKRGISLISANKQLVQGGHYEAGVRVFLLDVEDLPENTTLTTDDWLVVENKRYDVERVEIAAGRAWLIKGRAVSGRAANQVFAVGSESLLSLTHESTGVL